MGRKMACSFCGGTADKVARLIAGPGVFICDRCVELCNGVLAGHSTDPFSLDGASEETLLASLLPADAAVAAVAETLRKRIDELRRRDVSWQRIGEALGVSRQAVWERFS